MQIHLVATIFVVCAGFYFKISRFEWLAVILTIALVLVAEIVNTAIEEIVNFISPNFNEKAGLIKDLGAAFVLIAAIFAIVVGAIVFIPYL
jgi:diacylglycerol kinase